MQITQENGANNNNTVEIRKYITEKEETHIIKMSVFANTCEWQISKQKRRSTMQTEITLIYYDIPKNGKN